MTRRKRLAILRLTLLAGMALALSASFAAPSIARKGDISAQSARINELSRALAIREKALLREHPDVAALLNNLGQLYRGDPLFNPAQERPAGKRSTDKLVAQCRDDRLHRFMARRRHRSQCLSGDLGAPFALIGEGAVRWDDCASQ